ncbi:MAG: preprotein translocase subunit YajC [Bdellovibrionia bacterium]
MTLDMKTCFKIKLLELNLSLAALLVGGSAFADGPAIPAGSSPLSNAVAPAANQQPAGFMAFMPFLLMFGVLYFLILRPQQKKLKDQQQMLTSLKHGDEIVTTSGILGKVTGITDKVVTVEVADNVKVKMLKSQVSQVIKGSVKDLA